MADPHSGNDLNPVGAPGAGPRRRYILRVTVGYAVLAGLWIYFSDSLLSTLVDVATIHRLSTAKGLLFVAVTALLLVAALRGVPGEGAQPPAAPGLGTIFAAAPETRVWLYVFAVVISVVHLQIEFTLQGAPGAGGVSLTPGPERPPVIPGFSPGPGPLRSLGRSG